MSDAPSLRCLVCGHDELHQGSYEVTPLRVWGANREATCFACARCGFLHWFVPVPPP